MTPSPSFIALTRRPDLPSPSRVERTVKNEGDVEIVSPAITRWANRSKAA